MIGPLRTACLALVISFALITILLIPDVSWQPTGKEADVARQTLPTASISSPRVRPDEATTETQSTPRSASEKQRVASTPPAPNKRVAAHTSVTDTSRTRETHSAAKTARVPASYNTPPVHAAIQTAPRTASRLDAERPVPDLDEQRYASSLGSKPGVVFQTIRPSIRRSHEQGSSAVETRLMSMERQLTQLAQAQLNDKSSELDRATQLLQQMQQTTRLQELERQLQSLKSDGSQPPSTAVQPKALQAPTANETAQPEASVTSTEKKADKPAVMNIQSTDGDDERFSLQIQDAQLAQVLDMLGQLAGVNILPDKDVAGVISANLQDVTIDEALHAILRSRGYVFEREAGFIYVMSTAQQRLNRKLITKVYRPNYITAADLQALIVPILSEGIGKVAVTSPAEVGIALSPDAAGGDHLSQSDALLVQDYDEIILEVDRIVSEMDIPPMQVVIEAMILSVQLDDSMQFGINFALVNNASDNLLVSGNGATLGNTSGLPNGTDQSIMPAMGNAFLANTAGLKYGFIQGNISAFVNALESITDTNLVASPQLRVLNKQKAELIIGNRVSYRTLAFNGTQTVENVNFLDAGTKLVMRPFIAPDGLVRLEVHPERSNATIDENTGLPNLQTTEVTTNVMVRDGSTVVIGGLIEEQVQEGFNRIPLLGAIPYAGKLFRNRSESVRRTELIVLLTPRIVVEPEPGIEGDIIRHENEERAAHFRDNLSQVNRRNLARLQYERAVELYEQGELNWAKDYIERALEQSKNDLNALRLRDMINEAIRQRNRNFWKQPQPQPFEPSEYPAEPEYSEIPAAEETSLPPLPAPNAAP